MTVNPRSVTWEIHPVDHPGAFAWQWTTLDGQSAGYGYAGSYRAACRSIRRSIRRHNRLPSPLGPVVIAKRGRRLEASS